jgi:CRP-like cAMP-binding protein
MIRALCALVLGSLALLIAMLLKTEASTAIPFSFLAMPVLALAIALYAYYTWGPVRMNDEERRLYELAFSSLEQRDFVRLVALGTWQDAQRGEKLIHTGEHPEVVRVLLSGKVSLQVAGETLGELGPGRLVGSALILTDEPSQGDVIAVEPTRVLAWPTETLGRVLEKKPRVRSALQAIVSEDLARKVQALSSR